MPTDTTRKTTDVVAQQRGRADHTAMYSVIPTTHDFQRLFVGEQLDEDFVSLMAMERRELLSSERKWDDEGGRLTHTNEASTFS